MAAQISQNGSIFMQGMAKSIKFMAVQQRIPSTITIKAIDCGYDEVNGIHLFYLVAETNTQDQMDIVASIIRDYAKTSSDLHQLDIVKHDYGTKNICYHFNFEYACICGAPATAAEG